MHASPSATYEFTRGLVDARGRGAAGFVYDSGEDWGASGRLVRTSRGVVISELTVYGLADQDEEPRPVTSAMLRRVPTGEIIATAIAEGLLGAATSAPTPKADKRQPGRQPLPDELLHAVAESYLRETAPGMPRGAIGRLAASFEKPPATISRWVMRARADGWLGPAVPGREGGGPGPRLIDLMSDDLRTRLAGPPEFTEPPEE